MLYSLGDFSSCGLSKRPQVDGIHMDSSEETAEEVCLAGEPFLVHLRLLMATLRWA